MARTLEPLSAAQIHSVYATEKAFSNKASATEVVQYSKTSAYKREPVPSGRFPERSGLSNKSRK
jgi:hypothetical protein